jgi:hypothetical protein
MSEATADLSSRDSNLALEQFLDDYRRRLQLARLRSALERKGTLGEEPRSAATPQLLRPGPRANPVRRYLTRLRRLCVSP